MVAFCRFRGASLVRRLALSLLLCVFFCLGVLVVARVLCFPPSASVSSEGAVPSSPVLRWWGLRRVSRLARRGLASGRVFVVFLFRFGSRRVWGGFRAVVSCCASRSEAASLLWRFRAARRWWRSSAAPARSSAVWPGVPVFGLRWLAWRPCAVAVLPRLPGARSAFRGLSWPFGRVRFSVPAGRRPRPCCPSSLVSWAGVPASVFGSVGL